MGITTYTQELASPVASGRMFKALVLDSRALMSKLLPHFIKSVDVVQGDGGAGSIEQVNDSQVLCINHTTLLSKLSRDIELDVNVLYQSEMRDKLEYIADQIQFEEGNKRSCICKMTSNYHGIGEFEVKEEEIKAGKDSAMAIYKVVQAYLLENPHVYV